MIEYFKTLHKQEAMKFWKELNFWNKIHDRRIMRKVFDHQDQPIPIGIPSADENGELHVAVLKGDVREVKGLLSRGCSVNALNSLGQTPLFCASYSGQYQIVKALLKQGANPNYRCVGDYTAVHAACFNGSVRLLQLLIEFGGYLNIHDGMNRTPREWALRQYDRHKREKMTHFIESVHAVAMKEVLKENIFERNWNRGSFRDTLSQILRKKRTSPKHYSDSVDEDDSILSHTNFQRSGFCKLYFESGEKHFLCSLPFVNEADLRADCSDSPYKCGSFTEMLPYMWGKIKVTVKTLPSSMLGDLIGDLIFQELEVISKLKHPQILLLMGVCPILNMDSALLIYERVSEKTLFHLLHNEEQEIDYSQIISLLLQICEAIIYIHQRNWIHAAITSRAVHLVTSSNAKLGDFEHSIEMNPTNQSGINFTKAREGKCIDSLCNWLAPEILSGKAVTPLCDVYSFNCVMWEVFMRKIPWSGYAQSEIYREMTENNRSLPLNKEFLPLQIFYLLEIGLQVNPKLRDLELKEIIDMLRAAKKDVVTPRRKRNSTQFEEHKASKRERLKRSHPDQIHLGSQTIRTSNKSSLRQTGISSMPGSIVNTPVKTEAVLTNIHSLDSVWQRRRTGQDSLAIKPASHQTQRQVSDSNPNIYQASMQAGSIGNIRSTVGGGAPNGRIPIKPASHTICRHLSWTNVRTFVPEYTNPARRSASDMYGLNERKLWNDAPAGAKRISTSSDNTTSTEVFKQSPPALTVASGKKTWTDQATKQVESPYHSANWTSAYLQSRRCSKQTSVEIQTDPETCLRETEHFYGSLPPSGSLKVLSKSETLTGGCVSEKLTSTPKTINADYHCLSTFEESVINEDRFLTAIDKSTCPDKNDSPKSNDDSEESSILETLPRVLPGIKCKESPVLERSCLKNFKTKDVDGSSMNIEDYFSDNEIAESTTKVGWDELPYLRMTEEVESIENVQTFDIYIDDELDKEGTEQEHLNLMIGKQENLCYDVYDEENLDCPVIEEEHLMNQEIQITCGESCAVQTRYQGPYEMTSGKNDEEVTVNSIAPAVSLSSVLQFYQ